MEASEETKKKNRSRSASNRQRTNGATAYDAKWDDAYERLRTFRARHGHCNISYRFKEDPMLGRWASIQRSHFRRWQANEPCSLTAERIQKLNDIGFDWTVGEQRQIPWETRYAELQAFVQKYRHCRVPMGWQENPQLATWVSTQRQEYQNLQRGRPARLDQERIDKLNALNFIWDAKLKRGRELVFPPRRSDRRESRRHGDPPLDAASPATSEESEMNQAKRSNDGPARRAKRLKRSARRISGVSGASRGQPGSTTSEAAAPEVSGRSQQKDPPRASLRSSDNQPLATAASESVAAPSDSSALIGYVPTVPTNPEFPATLSPASLLPRHVAGPGLSGHSVPSDSLWIYPSIYRPQAGPLHHRALPTTLLHENDIRSFYALQTPHAALAAPLVQYASSSTGSMIGPSQLPPMLRPSGAPSLVALPTAMAIPAPSAFSLSLLGMQSSLLPPISISTTLLVPVSTLAPHEQLLLHRLASAPAHSLPAPPPPGRRMT